MFDLKRTTRIFQLIPLWLENFPKTAWPSKNSFEDLGSLFTTMYGTSSHFDESFSQKVVEVAPPTGLLIQSSNVRPNMSLNNINRRVSKKLSNYNGIRNIRGRIIRCIIIHRCKEAFKTFQNEVSLGPPTLCNFERMKHPSLEGCSFRPQIYVPTWLPNNINRHV